MHVRAWLSARRRAKDTAYWLVVVARDVRGMFSTWSSKPTAMPTHVSIEPSNLCNANCVFCGYQNQTRPHREVDPSFAFRVIDRARDAGVRNLGLTPIVGEPLVNKELEAIIRYARASSPELDIGVTTNGILLSPKRYLSLVEAGVSSITVSMTFPDPDEYAQIYRTTGFRTLMRNLEAILVLYRPTQCRVSLGVRSPRAGALRHPLFRRARQAGWVLESNQYLDDWSGQVGDAIASLGMSVRPLRPKRLPCTMLYTGPHFLSDGRATACGCRDLDGVSELSLDAEALLADLSGSYATGALEGLRQRFRSDSAPRICQSCRHYTPQYAGEPVRLRLSQLWQDVKAASGRGHQRRHQRKLTVLQGMDN